MGDCLRGGKLSHYVTSYPGQLSFPSLRESVNEYQQGRYGSFRLRMNLWVCREHISHLSASEMVFHEEALYQVYVPLPLPLTALFLDNRVSW